MTGETTKNQIHQVSNFQELITTPFYGEKNAMCWNRDLRGDFKEIINKLENDKNILKVSTKQLLELELSSQGKLARDIIINDFKQLENHGTSPTINVIKNYERDDAVPFFPTDVYSFHVDRSTIPTDTFLCTYHGESSEIIPNSQVQKKAQIPEIRKKLMELFNETEEGFESFSKEFFFDLHYQQKPNSVPIKLGKGHLWKLAIDHPEKNVPPCVHRAPLEKNGESRLLMIC